MTSIFLSHDNLDVLQVQMNIELRKVTYWLCLNKLSINISKTQYMVFTNKKYNAYDLRLELANSVISKVSNVKFLGVMIDDKLQWTNHINLICNKISKNIGVMYKLCSFPKHILKMIYYALIAPFLSYGILAYGSAPNSLLDRIFKLQKRAIRIINHSSFLAHTEPIFKQHKILKFYDLYKLETALFMFTCHKCLLPQSLSQYFELNNEVHTYPTRSSSNYHLPLVRTNLVLKSIFYRGPLCWNSLPVEVRDSCSLNVFKGKLKRYMICLYSF